MINLIKIKSILIFSLSMLVAFFLFTSCSENKTTDTKNVAQQENLARLVNNDQAVVVVKNNNDTKFLMEAAEMQLEEISLGQLAQQRNTSPSVRNLGKMMETDHSKSLNELKALAQLKSVSIPISITDDSKGAYESLRQKSGNDFSKAYCKLMVKHHEDAIELFEKVSTSSEDPEIRNWATRKIPGLITHLKHAQECENINDKL